MGVLQPWLLALGAGVAIPLLLHLLQRHQGPRVVFPALRYLRRAERDSARRIRLRQWLLLLLRVGVVWLLALAAARPFLAGRGAAHEPSAVVIVLDNSLSTSAVVGDTRVFDVLRERALETLAAAAAEDRFWLLLAASPELPARGGDGATLAALVRAARPTDTAADISGALARARAILAADAAGRAPEIQLLSDLQASELQAMTPVAGAPPLLVWAPPGAPPPNRWISALTLPGDLAPLAGSRAQLVAAVSGVQSDSVGLRLMVNGRLAAVASTLAGTATPLTLPAQPPGLLQARVEMDPDALHGDDQRFLVTRVATPPVVASPGASDFLNEALGAMARAGRLRTGSPIVADVIIQSTTATLPPLRTRTALVMLPPVTDVELPAVNGELERLGIPWRYGPTVSGGETWLASSDTIDPLLRSIGRAHLVRSYPLRRLGATTGDSVLLRTVDGVPWAVRGTSPAGSRYVLLGSPLDEASSDIPTSAAMIPLLGIVVDTWAGVGAERLEAAIGEEVTLPAGSDTVVRPDSTAETVEGASYLVPPVTGIYQVRSADSLLSAFAVNSPQRESDLRRIARRDIGSTFAGWAVRSTDSAAGWRRLMFSARLGSQLWRPLLLLLLVLLLVEALIAASGSGHRAQSVPGSD